MARYNYQSTFMDGQGRVVASGTVTVYKSGTTTLLSIYSTATGLTPITGSVVTTGNDGSFAFWAEESTCKMTLSASGFVTKSYDYVDGALLMPDYIEADQSVTGVNSTIMSVVTTINGANREIILSPGTYIFLNNYTVPANITLTFQKGALLSPITGKTVTISGTVNSGNYQIFTGAGSIAFGNGYEGIINGLWFGVVQDWNGSTGTDNSTALQAWITSLPTSGIGEMPPVINRGISYSTNVAMGGHNNILRMNNNVFKYTGNAVGFDVRGDKTEINDMFLIGNATATAGFHFINNNCSRFKRVYVFGTAGIAFDLEGGPLGSLWEHCGTDQNSAGVINNSVLSTSTWGGDPSIVFKIRLHVASGQEPNCMTFVNCNTTCTTGNTTTTGWDVNAGNRITWINPILQRLNYGYKIYDAGYAGGQKPTRLNIHNAHFEPGTFNTATISDGFASNSDSYYGIAEDYLGGNIQLARRTNFGLYTQGSGNLPIIGVSNTTSTHAQGQALKGDSQNGTGVLGTLSNPSGSVVAAENWGAVVGQVSSGTVGIGIRGRGANSATSYSGYFEQGIFYSTNLSPQIRTITANANINAVGDYTILLNAATLTATLPAATSCAGQIVVVKLIAAATTGTVGSAGGNIDGAASYSLSAQYKYVVVQSDGTNWYITANN